jgi:hypothetical protein
MKATCRPFKAKQYGKCPIGGVHPIKEGDLIVRLEVPFQWTESNRLVPRGRGRFFTDLKSTQYVHAKCLEERNDDE